MSLGRKVSNPRFIFVRGCFVRVQRHFGLYTIRDLTSNISPNTFALTRSGNSNPVERATRP